MLNRNRVSLPLAATIAASLLLIVANAKGQEPSGSEERIERTFKTRPFNDMPVAVHRVTNLQSDEWYQDLGIEIKNISSKPIYFILAYLDFPDVPAPGNGVTGISMEFGEHKNIDVSRIAELEDPRLNPGETVVLTIRKQYRNGLKVKQERHPEMVKRFELHFGLISFGDGTGFAAERYGDYRVKKSHSSAKQIIIQTDPGLLRSRDVSQEERVFDNQIPKHLPIQVRIRAAKERAAKDLSNERWHRDLEMEVKNTGEKPIYYLSLILEMPEIRVNGDPVTFVVRYGERSLFDDFKGRAQPEDIPFKPRDTLILSLVDGQAGGWEIAKARDNWLQPKKVVIEFEQLNFGDGTGFFTGAGVAWPLPKCSELATKGIPCRGRP